MSKCWLSSSHPAQVVRQCHNLVLLIVLHSQLTLVETMAKQTEPVMARAIRVLSKHDSSHQFHPSISRLIGAQNLLENLTKDFHDHSLSSTRPIFLKVSRSNSTIIGGVSRLWSWPNNGELTFWMPKRLYIFIRCSIVKEGSDLDTEIHKESRRRKIITLGRAPQGDLLCKASIRFDDLWEHLILELQEEANRELILVSIAYDRLKIPQQTFQWDLQMQRWDFSSGSSPKYAFDCYQYINSLSKCIYRPMGVICRPWMHKSGVQ